MNWDQIEGKWKQVKGQVKERWGKLTDDDLDIINGRRDQLEGKLQTTYGRTREQVQNEVNEFMKSCNCENPSRESIERDRMAAEGGAQKHPVASQTDAQRRSGVSDSSGSRRY